MSLEALGARATFAAALLDVLPSDARAVPGAFAGIEPAYVLGDVVVVLAASASAAAIVHEAPPLLEPPEIVTPWARARRWAARHADAPVGPVLSLARVQRLASDAERAGLALVDPGPDPIATVVDGCLARAFVLVPRARAPRRPKLRLDRVQDAWVRANGPGLAPDQARGVEDHALVVLAQARADGERLRVKELVRRARAAVKASADDGKRVAAALVTAWARSDVELALE